MRIIGHRHLLLQAIIEEGSGNPDLLLLIIVFWLNG
jgi:hypothetical protein